MVLDCVRVVVDIFEVVVGGCFGFFEFVVDNCSWLSIDLCFSNYVAL